MREEVQKVNRMGMRAYLDEQLHPERISDTLVGEKLAGLKTMRLSSRELIELYPPVKQQAGQQEMMGQQQMQGPRAVILELQQARLLRSVYSQRQLYEIIVDFWSNHFNVFSAKGADRWLTTAYDRDTIRPHALGKFRDLLLATAQSPAMLFYLDNWLSASPDSKQPRPPRPPLPPNAQPPKPAPGATSTAAGVPSMTALGADKDANMAPKKD